jgi:cell division protein FtsB
LATLAQAWSNSQLQQKVQVAAQSLQKTQDEHKKLETQVQHYKDPAVIESEARQHQGYVRPGEQPVVVTNDGKQKQTEKPQNAQATQPQNYWQEWWNTFFS